MNKPHEFSRSKLNSSYSGIYNQSIMNSKMKVQKRGARGFEFVKFDKITDRINNLCSGLDATVDSTRVALTTIKNLYDGITTEELDKISARTAESLKLVHPDYSILAARILISNLHKTTPKKFSECMKIIGEKLSIKSDRHYKFIEDNAVALDNMIIDSNDYNFDYFGYKTLENSYLHKIKEELIGSDGKIILVDREGNVVPYSNISYTRRKKPVLRNGSGVIVSMLHAKTADRVMDRPQYMYMRVAVAIYMDSDTNLGVVLENIKQCYKALSQMYFTHATPTLFNACSKIQQLNSCFLLGTDDSIEGIMKNLSHASFISKWAGGIGIHMNNIRCRESDIKGTNGKSSGLPKQLKIYNEAARCWDQGGKRLGAFAIYLEPWHGDIMKFLELKLNQGAETERARDLFYALWVNDLFVRRVEEDADWSLFSENTAPGLSDVYDGMDVCSKCGYCENINYAKFVHDHTADELDDVKPVPDVDQSTCDHTFEPVDAFTKLYTEYEEEGLAVRVVKAREVIDAICEMQRESGTPYICFKDHVNRMTNQSNIGTIKSSNLCAEIMEWSSDTSYACCTLASINLKKFIVEGKSADGVTKYSFDYARLHDIVRMIARNLDIIIDVNTYPVDECEDNSQKFRPIAIGVQGLADVYAIMRIPFCSTEAADIDLKITETIYHAALEESCARAATHGPYSAWMGSPAARGELQFDLWLKNQLRINGPLAGANIFSGMYDWDIMKKSIMSTGLRNSLHVAYMPTVSTSQIMGNNESFEPFSSNIYTKTTLVGKFTITNNYMIRHLIELGLWNEEIKNKIINNNGSLAGITEIPAEVREIYKTVWEIKQTELMRRAALRSAFIDQSQSLNIHLMNNSNALLRGVLINGWKLGLKTGSYYVRTQEASGAMKNNIAATKQPAASLLDHIVGPTMAKIARERNDPIVKLLEGIPRDVETDNNIILEDVPSVTETDIDIEDKKEEFVCYREAGCTMCSG